MHVALHGVPRFSLQRRDAGQAFVSSTGQVVGKRRICVYHLLEMIVQKLWRHPHEYTNIRAFLRRLTGRVSEKVVWFRDVSRYARCARIAACHLNLPVASSAQSSRPLTQDRSASCGLGMACQSRSNRAKMRRIAAHRTPHTFADSSCTLPNG